MINGLEIANIMSVMACEGQEKIRYILDDTLLIAKLALLDYMPELDRRVLLGAGWVIERDVHHLTRGVVNIPVRVGKGSCPHRCITTEKTDTLFMNG